MIAAVVAGQDCWLVTHAPNTDEPVRLGVKLPVDTQRALTGPRSTRPQGLSLRTSWEWSVQMTAAEFAAARASSQTAQDEPILVPAWCFAVAAGGTLAVTSDLVLAWTAGWATWAINPGSFAAYDFKAPLLFGRMTPPRMAGRNGEHVLADFSFDEDGAYPLLPPTATDATLATVSGYAAPIFPFGHEGSQPPVPGLATVEAMRTQTGPGRIRSSEFYPQVPERTLSATFKFKTAAAAAQLLGWWQRRAGTADPHWVAETQSVGRLAVDAALSAGSLTFASPPLVGTNRTLALSVPGTIEIVRASGVSGTTATLAAGLAHNWPALWTNVTLAMLARHTDAELVIEFRRADADWLAVSTIAWREVAAEYTPPAGETRGTTLGRLPAAWWGFQVDLDYNGAVVSTYLTNWESGDTVLGGHTWAYNDCSFSKLTQSIDLEADECTFNFHWWAGCPWQNWLPGQLAARGLFSIWRADVAPDGTFSNLRQVWAGELSTPDHEGELYRVKVLGANTLFSRKGPRQTCATSCGTNAYSTRCGLDRADWKFTAVIASASGSTITVDTIARANGGALPAGFGFANWFAMGYLQATVGGVPVATTIANSTALSGGAITLGLDRPAGVGVGASVVLVPICDRQVVTCRAYDATTNPLGKFDNRGNFRGFEDNPPIAPNFIIPQRNATPAKK